MTGEYIDDLKSIWNKIGVHNDKDDDADDDVTHNDEEELLEVEEQLSWWWRGRRNYWLREIWYICQEQINGKKRCKS